LQLSLEYFWRMRKAAVAALLLLVFGLVVGFTLIRSSDDAQARAPSLRLVRKTPLTVRGEEFRPAERVRLRAMLNRGTVATANGHGSFVAQFGAPKTRCDLVRVIAVGSEGSHAVLKLLPAPACIVARTPSKSK
jgi:hypothetical protein